MNKINEDFNIPFYIFEEIVQYVEKSAQRSCRCMKWNNIKSLLKLAQINNLFTQEQVDFLIKTYCRE